MEHIKEGGTKRINQELQRKREQEGKLSGTAKAVARTALAVRGFHQRQKRTAKAVALTALAVASSKQTLERFFVPLKRYILNALAVPLVLYIFVLKPNFKGGRLWRTNWRRIS